MPPRKKPTSTTKKKEQQKLKRAIKRGDIEKPAPVHTSRKRKGPKSRLANSDNHEAIEKAKRLQSSFLRPSQAYLHYTREVVSNSVLPRPISANKIVFDEADFSVRSPFDAPMLTCPKRPKWRYEMTKNEVEKNEEGLHVKWLASTDLQLASTSTEDEAVSRPPSSLSYFERNLEVWRQLWRVTEISSLLVCLLDLRAPLLHLPQSLISYLETFCPSQSPSTLSESSSRPKRKTKSIVLVLTKADITTPALTDAWMTYFRSRFPLWGVVCIHSYNKKEEGWAEQGLSRPKFTPGIPDDYRSALVQTLKNAHEELIVRPQDASDKWKPPREVKKVVDWNMALRAPMDQILARPMREEDKEHTNDESDDEHEEVEPTFLTIGLIGQPNVGKSSLLNALFGTSKVRASRTPGKTKHFQTLFLTPEIRIVDCPGLVFPSYVRMEAQVLSGILPISKISAIFGCMNWIGERLPLEQVLHLQYPSEGEDVEDKRTWRDGGHARAKKEGANQKAWTSMDILTAYARKKGWVTAKAGREDVMRAGNAILRSLAEGRIRWAFAPPGFEPSEDSDLGIALPGGEIADEPLSDVESEPEGDDDEQHDGEDEPSPSDQSEDSEDISEEDVLVPTTSGRFAALVED